MINKILFKFVQVLILLGMITISVTGCGTVLSSKDDANKVYSHSPIITFEDAKKQLLDGNERYVSNKVLKDDLSSNKRKELVDKGQKPFATILTCSDSRVPPEIIFDQALGDLFIIRNAGNVIDPVTLGSIEYGAEHLNTPIIVVLGHCNCGAVKATVEGGESSGNIGEIVKRIEPSLEKARDVVGAGTEEQLCEECENENINNSINEIRKSPIIKKLIEENKVELIGAKYDLVTGEVRFNELE